MGIFDFRWPQQNQQAPQQQNQQPSNNQMQQPGNSQQNPWTSNQGITSDPSAGAGNQNSNSGNFSTQNSSESSKQSQSSLDAFNDLWQTDPNAKSQVQESLFSFDPAKLAASIKNLDFSKTVSPELMQKAMSGDQQAFSQVLNQVTQTAFGQSVELFTKMMEHGFQKNTSKFEQRLPEMFKNWGAAEELSGDPIFQHPATKPVFEAVQRQLAEKYPERSAKEIAKSAREFIQLLAAQVGTNQTSDQKPNSNNPLSSFGTGTDFSSFLDS